MTSTDCFWPGWCFFTAGAVCHRRSGNTESGCEQERKGRIALKGLIAKLEEWGAEPQEAVRQMMGDESFYFCMLEKFKEKKAWEQLGECVQKGQYQEAFQIAHDLKGNAAVLGLLPLKKCISEVVEDLRSENVPLDLKRDMEVFGHEVEVFKEIMRGCNGY